MVGALYLLLKGRGFDPQPFHFGLVVCTHVPLSPSSKLGTGQRGGDALQHRG